MRLNLEKDSRELEPFEREVLDYLKKAAASGGEIRRLESDALKTYRRPRAGQLAGAEVANHSHCRHASFRLSRKHLPEDNQHAFLRSLTDAT